MPQKLTQYHISGRLSSFRTQSVDTQVPRRRGHHSERPVQASSTFVDSGARERKQQHCFGLEVRSSLQGSEGSPKITFRYPVMRIECDVKRGILLG
jgi:hypothetical protein